MTSRRSANRKEGNTTPEGGAASAARQEIAEDRDDLGQEIANVRENLDEASRGTRAELRRLLGPPSATLIGGFAVSLPIALDRVAAEMRPASAEAVRSLEGGARYLEGRIGATG